MVDQPDLLAWLGLPPTATAEEARAALERERKRMQSMQGNPKYRDLAKLVIKSFRPLDELLADPRGYLDKVASSQATTHMPLLELAIDGVLADGVITDEEEAFVREQAMRLGIAVELYEQVLRERCALRGVTVPRGASVPPPPPVVATVGPSTGEFRVPTNLQAAHRTAGTGWWDDTFTRLLRSHVPTDARRVVDLSVGLGWTALAILPERPEIEFLGIDEKDLEVEVARRNLAQAGLSGRAVIQRHDPARLPLPDGAVDVVLCIMNLQSFRDSRPLFDEAARLLRPGGRLVAVEPDCLGQQFWFDRNLTAFNDAFQALCERVDEVVRDTSGNEEVLGQPSIALGPELGRRMAAAGLDDAELELHPVQISQRCTFAAFARRLRKRVDAMAAAASLPAEDREVRTALDEIARLEGRHEEGAVGTGVHLLPLFLVVGFKD